MKSLFAAIIICALSICALAQSTPPTTWKDNNTRKTAPSNVTFPDDSIVCTGPNCVVTFTAGAGTVTASGTLTSGKAILGNGTTSIVASRLTLTNPATTATFTLADNKTFTVSNTLTLAGTDSTVMTFPSTTATIARTDAAQTFTGSQTFSSPVLGPAGTNSLPSFAASTDPDTGFFSIASNIWGFSGGTTNGLALGGSVVFLASSSYLQWSSSTVLGTGDTRLLRAAANTLRISDLTTGAGNLIVGPSSAAVGTSGIGTIVVANGTAPSSSPADEWQAYSADWNGAGTAAPHFRNEEGTIYQLGSRFISPSMTPIAVTAATLPTTNGTISYCSDCQPTSAGTDNTCTGSGTGALVIRLNGVSRCFSDPTQ